MRQCAAEINFDLDAGDTVRLEPRVNEWVLGFLYRRQHTEEPILVWFRDEYLANLLFPPRWADAPYTDIELSDPEIDALVAELEEQKAPR